jgi:hypothetical protein
LQIQCLNRRVAGLAHRAGKIVNMEIEVTEKVTRKINVKYMHILVPGDDEEFPEDFPFLNEDGDLSLMIDLDTGKIDDQPPGREVKVFCKPVDSGTYTLFDADKKRVTVLSDYVPNRVIPGSYGDYIEMAVRADGTIKDWPKDPDLSEFFCNDDE